MKRFLITLFIIAACISGSLGCAGNGSAVAPGNHSQLMQSAKTDHAALTFLWGYYDVFIDIPTKTATAVVNRHAMFTANVVNFLNGTPPRLGFHINDTPVGSGYIDVDIDVSITHPFAGYTQYNGYDVRGVFMGDGSASLKYNSKLTYPVLGTDQSMLPDPDDGIGGPDGYTRWFNKTEFSQGGMPLFSYTQGSMATPGFAGTATLCPYKYFANNLGKNDDLYTWLRSNTSSHGVFSAGVTNTRNYYIRFPYAKGVKFGYAVTANWKGVTPQDHPSNAPEAVALSVTDSSDVYYASPSDKGGKLKLDIGVWNWDSQLSAGRMEDYKLFIESSVLSTPAQFASMTPTGGGNCYSTYHVEIPANNIQGNNGNEYWVIVEQQGYDYTNDFGVGNLAGTDPLAAAFRYNLSVPSNANHDPICNLVVVSSVFEAWGSVPVEFDASASYDPDPGDTLQFAWDFNGDGIYGGTGDDYTGTPSHPIHKYTSSFTGVVSVKVTDGKGGESICSTGVLNIIVHNCPPVNVPSGSPASHSVSYSNSCRSGIVRGYGAGGKEYFIGHTCDYSGMRYGFYAFDENGAVVQNYMSPAQPNYPPTLQGMACTSTNRVYVIAYTQYIYYDNILYYVDFDPSTGFSGLLQTAPMPSIAPWSFIKITVDENDHPVAFVANGTQYAIEHWNGTSWTLINIVDSATMYNECGYAQNGIEDIAYQPVNKTYWITNRYHGYTPDYDGVPTLYVINSDGTTAWKDNNIYPSCPPYTQYSAGVDIDPKYDCRTLVLICCGTTGANSFVARFIRYDPFGNISGSGYMSNGPSNYCFANGCVITNSGSSWYDAPLDMAGASTALPKFRIGEIQSKRRPSRPSARAIAQPPFCSHRLRSTSSRAPAASAAETPAPTQTRSRIPPLPACRSSEKPSSVFGRSPIGRA